jgi:glycerophosphoryl diester phosphodiesterase
MNTMMLLLSLVTLAGPDPSAPAPEATPPRPEVQGHRGARARLPENTMAGFEHALAVGADVIELDVLVTRDDQVVVAHDPVVNSKLCRGVDGAPVKEPRPIRALSLAELQRYDCGSVRHPDFPHQAPAPGARIPTLAQALALIKGFERRGGAPARVNVELKSVPAHPEWTPPPRPYVELVRSVIRAADMVGRVSLQSFDHDLLAEARAQDPAVVLAALIYKTRLHGPDLVDYLRRRGFGIYSPHHQWITAADVQRLHAAGVRVIPWTVNEPDDWRRVIAAGVDGIITDDPAALLRHLEVSP